MNKKTNKKSNNKDWRTSITYVNDFRLEIIAYKKYGKLPLLWERSNQIVDFVITISSSRQNIRSIYRILNKPAKLIAGINSLFVEKIERDFINID